jgi:hypothetical protein
MRDNLPVMLSHDVARFLRKIRAIAIGKCVELLDVFLFQSGNEAGKPLVQSTDTCGWTVGFDRCFKILFPGLLSINSCSSFLGKGFADLISFHGALAFYPAKVS